MAEEAEWAALAEATIKSAKMTVFDKPSKNMTKHLKLLYIGAHINSKAISRVIVDGGAMLNVMPVATMKKLGKKKDELDPTNMKMTNFTIKTTTALGVLVVVDVTVGTKTLSSAFLWLKQNPSMPWCWEGIGFILVSVSRRLYTKD